jgi:hypothetical protein
MKAILRDGFASLCEQLRLEPLIIKGDNVEESNT